MLFDFFPGLRQLSRQTFEVFFFHRCGPEGLLDELQQSTVVGINKCMW